MYMKLSQNFSFGVLLIMAWLLFSPKNIVSIWSIVLLPSHIVENSVSRNLSKAPKWILSEGLLLLYVSVMSVTGSVFLIVTD